MTKPLKDQDSRGSAPHARKRHKRHPRLFWVEFIESYRRSGLSAKKFCELGGVGYSTFAKWQRVLRDETIKTEGQFISVELDKASVVITRASKQYTLCRVTDLRFLEV